LGEVLGNRARKFLRGCILKVFGFCFDLSQSGRGAKFFNQVVELSFLLWIAAYSLVFGHLDEVEDFLREDGSNPVFGRYFWHIITLVDRFVHILDICSVFELLAVAVSEFIE
jgi:hypothetical protein